jgi:transposase
MMSEGGMTRFIQGEDRAQQTLFPGCLDDHVADDNPARVVDAYVDQLDLRDFDRAQPADTGRPGYHPSTLLKIYLYGYLNRIQSSRRLEREAQRNVELMWLTGRLAPDFKTIADFRRDNGASIRAACARFILICRQLGLFAHAVAAIDGSKFKGVNARERNFTRGKLKRRVEQVEESIGRYLQSLDAADLQKGEVAQAKAARLKDKIAAMKQQLARLQSLQADVLASPGQQISLTDPDARAMATSMRGSGVVGYNVQAAVDTEHHLIVTHEVTNVVLDRSISGRGGYLVAPLGVEVGASTGSVRDLTDVVAETTVSVAGVGATVSGSLVDLEEGAGVNVPKDIQERARVRGGPQVGFSQGVRGSAVISVRDILENIIIYRGSAPRSYGGYSDSNLCVAPRWSSNHPGR